MSAAADPTRDCPGDRPGAGLPPAGDVPTGSEAAGVDTARDMADAARTRHERREHWMREGEPSLMRQVGQIGMLGWMIVTPGLLGLFLGRWIDRELQSGIFWSAPLLLVGLAMGCWSAWRWMHRQ